VPDADGRPTVLVAQTVKGKGLSMAEGTYTWHSTVPTTAEVDQARAELVPDLADTTIGGPDQAEVAQSGSELRIEGGRV
jgi:transketolase